MDDTHEDEWEKDESDSTWSPPPEKSPGDITAAEKYEFLHHIRQGLNRQEASHILGYRGRHFRSICSPNSMFYDEEFAADYGRAIGSPEHAEGRLERLRAEAQRRALTGSDRLLEKMLMVHDPDWKILREKDVNVEVNVRHFIESNFKTLSVAQIDELIAALDAGEEMPVDAEYRELPPPSVEAA